jgi:hypothetical protein
MTLETNYQSTPKFRRQVALQHFWRANDGWIIALLCFFLISTYMVIRGFQLPFAYGLLTFSSSYLLLWLVAILGLARDVRSDFAVSVRMDDAYITFETSDRLFKLKWACIHKAKTVNGAIILYVDGVSNAYYVAISTETLPQQMKEFLVTKLRESRRAT